MHAFNIELPFLDQIKHNTVSYNMFYNVSDGCAPGVGLPYLGMVGRFGDDDPRF